MEPDELIRRHPRLYHMAQEGSWPTISTYGLRSTSALLDLFEVPEPQRRELESARRPESVTISHPDHGTAVIRDNKPLNEAKLAASLDGCTLPEFYRLLNSKVFFWPSERRLRDLLGARAYRDRGHTVIVIDTARLVERHGADITLSRINSGAVLYRPPRRGPWTFERIADFAPRTPDGRRLRNVAEVAVTGSVPDVAAVAVEVFDVSADRTWAPIWAAR